MDWTEGDLVWFDPGLGHPIPGKIEEVHRAAQVIIVNATIKGKAQTFTLAPGEGNLRPRQDLGPNGFEDMTQLDDLHEASLLWNLRIRYDKSLIYTFAGSILIAVNPYKMFPDAYGIEVAKQYVNKPLGTCPPHLFAIGSAAHAALPSPQVVVISGESGSGKTESTKLVMQYLAAVVPGGGSTSAVITEQILEAAPLLEAFGNARTTKNDNSSRFGKYLEVYFKSGAIVGAKITQYLLEKSRIVTQAQGERNYHVFYEMLSGLSEAERSKYGLLEASKYFYLNQGGTDCTAGRIDWDSLQGAMQVLGVSDNERDNIVRVLASILHLGNIYFHRRQLRYGQEGVELGSDAEIKWAAHLLQISAEDLHRSLTTRVTEACAERVHTALGIDQALDARDAFAKVLYAGLFNWLVSRVNSIVHKGGTHDAHRISILDIFGFENLPENSFEQLCINYANENLQLYFNKHVFKLEQAEYARERLEWTPLTWEDNLPVIHLLAKKPVGIFHLLDDESNFPRASDMSFLEKCHYNHALNELYSRPRIGAQAFGVTHYAGQVWYCVEGFLDKNRDALRTDVLDLLASSKLQLVCELTKQLRAQRDIGKTLPKGSDGRFVTMKPRTPTVAARFSDSLQQLLQSMSKCNPWFVRCIKPNNEKQALKMDMPCVLQQLRYLGMLDTIQIRQRGYPVRLRFQHFVERYRHLMKTPFPRGTPYRELCRNVLQTLPKTNVDGPDFQLGATRVFLREALHRALEGSRSERLKNAAVIIQKNVRRMLERKALQRKRRAAIRIQSVWRGHKQHKKYRALKKASIQAQALWRGRVQRKRYQKLKVDMKRRQEAIKAQKERQIQAAKESQEMSQISHLDVPAELAFIFSKIESWTPVHGDRHLVKIFGTVPGPPPPTDLPADLDQFTFGKFSSVYCNGLKLSPRRDPITTPFLSRTAARDQDFQDALAIFKLILRWTSDTPLDVKKEKTLADYIIHRGLASRSLRDEILVQLCNQVYHAEKNQAQRIWQLMAQCLSCFQPGSAFAKYLLKFIADNAPSPIKEILMKKLLRNSGSVQAAPYRKFPPSWLEWRAAAKNSDLAIALTLPNDAVQTIGVDSWTTCEEAAALAISTLGIGNQGWTVVLDDGGVVSDSCGLDYVLDLISERELCPAFPALRNELLKTPAINSRASVETVVEMNNPKRPQIPPPEPPEMKTSPMLEAPITKQVVDAKIEYTKHYEGAPRKNSHDALSRNSVLNERYFEMDKTRSRSLDDLLAGEPGEILEIEKAKPLDNIGLSNSRLNDRYHSAERLPPMSKETVPRYQKSQYAGRRSGGSNTSKYIDKSEYATRSSAMSDTSETPSLASHVRRVRVPSQASDVDQFLDDLFSPVLDGSLDELSDARSLAASIRGGGYEEFSDAPFLDEAVSHLIDANSLSAVIKGGAHRNDVNEDKTPTKNDSSQEYMGKMFQPIVINETKRTFEEKMELKGSGSQQSSDNGFPSSPGSASNSIMMMNSIPPEALMQMVNIPTGVDPLAYQQQVQRAFLQSAMAQNLQIQQQLLAQNQALQTLLSQQEPPTSPPNVQRSTIKTQVQTAVTTRKTSLKNRLTQFSDTERTRKASSDSNGSLIPPPPPPPMPPPIEFKDPSEARPFLDPYGRAKTVRIGKWRWPPPQDANQTETEEDFIFFKMRQNQRKNTPQSQNHSSNGSPNGSTIEWEEFEIEGNQFLSLQSSPQQSSHQIHHMPQRSEIRDQQMHVTITQQHGMTSKEHYQKKGSKQESPSPNHQLSSNAHGAQKAYRRSFEIGAERPPPGSVGKLKLSSEMRQRLEQVTAGHSVRSSISTRSEQRAPAKLEDARKMMLQQQLSGHVFSMSDSRAESPDLISVRSQVQRMEGGKKPPPPPWPIVVPPAPSGPAPPPPIRPPNTVPPAPPPAPGIQGNNGDSYQGQQQYPDIPAFVQRQERDTFGARHHNWNGSDTSKDTYDSWGRADVAKINMTFDPDFKKDAVDHARSRSRSRSRDRDNFSEAVWDRSEVEGPPSSFSDRERDKDHHREKRENLYDMKQTDRDQKESSVTTTATQSSTGTTLSSHAQKSSVSMDRETPTRKDGSRAQQANGRATFKTHMEQKYAKERERKISASTLTSQNDRMTDKNDDFDADDNWTVPTIPAPVPAPAASKSQVNSCFTYNRVTWKLRIRKEVFHPSEQIGPPAALDLLFIQIASDVLGVTSCLRISPQERRSAINLLNSHGVSVENIRGQLRAIIKRHLIDMARSWPLYFARLFVVNGAPQFMDVSILGISHNGVFLARKDTDHLTVVRSMPFTELQGAVTLPRPASLQIHMANGNRLTLHASRAIAIQAMVQQFLQEFRMVQSKSAAHPVRAKTVQPIDLAPERAETSRDTREARESREYHHHMVGSSVSPEKMLPQRTEHPQSHQANHRAVSSSHHQQSYHHSNSNMMNGGAMHEPSPEPTKGGHSAVKQSSYLHSRKTSPGNMAQSGVSAHDGSDTQSGLSPSVTKYSLLQFAMQHFRDDEILDDHKAVSTNGRGEKKQFAVQPHADLVKWQGTPIRAPLLRIPPDLGPLALECFDCILRYCGDIPPDPELTEVKCVYTVLMHCHKYLALRDEVYCQLMKQTTANRSPCPDSSQRAWRLLSILAAYFGCSNALKPYLMEHLTVAASDRRRSCHGTAAVCLTNLRKTARCGGRKNVPSVEEVTAVSAGRSARRQIYRLPGGAERVVNTRCSTVVADVIAELCGLLGIESEAEQQEFSLYCIVQGDAFTMPLAADEYILDVSTELLKSGQPFYLIFCRSVWHFPLKRDPAPTPLYTEVLFNQVAPDYLEGLLLEFPNNGMPSPDVVHDMARIAALLHRAADLNHVPTMKEIKFLLPKPALGIRELRPAQWVSLVQTAWASVAGLTPTQVKAQFLNVLSAWPLFGSSFFAVKRVWAEDDPNIEDSNPMWRDLILVLNRCGVLFLDPNTHETLQHWPFMEVISTRKVRSEDGALFLDMKVGNLMQQRVVRVQTEQAHEISRLVRQYITMAQVSQKDRRD